MHRIHGPIRILAAMAIMIATATTAWSQSQSPECGTAASLSFVRATVQPKRHLAGMIMGYATRTQAFSASIMEAKRRGFEPQIISHYQRLLDRTLLTHLQVWECNLSSAYSSHLTDDQLTSLTEQREQSPAFDELQTAKPQIDAQMKTNSEDVLRTAITEFLAGGHQFVQSYRPQQ